MCVRILSQKPIDIALEMYYRKKELLFFRRQLRKTKKSTHRKKRKKIRHEIKWRNKEYIILKDAIHHIKLRYQRTRRNHLLTLIDTEARNRLES